MSMKSTLDRLAWSVAGAAMVVSGAATFAQDRLASGMIEEIIVTAQKREESWFEETSRHFQNVTITNPFPGDPLLLTKDRYVKAESESQAA